MLRSSKNAFVLALLLLGACEVAPREVLLRQLGNETDWLAVSAGPFQSCGIKKDNTAWCWSAEGKWSSVYEDTQEVGYGAEPSRLHLEPGVIELKLSHTHACLLDVGGKAHCWGNNTYGQLGLGGVAATAPVDDTPVLDPQPVAGGRKWISLAVGRYHSCAVAANHKLWCWGSQVTDATLSTFPENVTEVAAFGSEEEWLRSKAWSSAPVLIDDAHRWMTVHIRGNLTCALDEYDRLFCHVVKNDPSKVVDFFEGGGAIEGIRMRPVLQGSEWQDVSFGGQFSCGADTLGRLMCWATDPKHPTDSWFDLDMSNPLRIGKGNKWARVTAGSDDVCALTKTGALWCYTGGQKNIDGVDRIYFLPVGRAHVWSDVSVGGTQACGVTSKGKLFCWETACRQGDDTTCK